ncbi:aminopeptidase P N-terminal domain-containing protein [Robiginitalea sp. M366]|uniref:aminopeptidase P N-terminal domain-containing protein n=1 Tax=Robiginitalea aestuariiviva TaxID=3036903 RepID=UPI00240E53E9|nr:aminopeptidase P N-terminal domain-containing protein [Robiginitalea aestuariiviva]MDG1571411.1 aminopeptidase P N-terminal domain-containing protein [Robiginitalea aestuariiviva]
MKYDPIPSDLYVRNRRKFTAHMAPKSLAVFNSNDIYPISADSTMPFRQHSDILYLSGVDQEESILLLFPDALDPKHKEVLFVRETNEHIAIWEGAKLTKEQAYAVSGIRTVYWLTDFDKVFFDLMTEAETIYFNTNEHYRQAVETETREARFIKTCKEKFPAHRVAKSNPILQEIRGVKEAEEIEQIRTACSITEKGFRRVLGFVKPGVWEYEIEAEFLHEFVRNRSRGFAYTPIIASGNNANVLHYVENNQQCQAGHLILMDVGAEYANFSSDMTRTIPVSGQFTKRQREVYDAVLRVKDAATQMLVPGTLWAEYHKEVGKIMTSELLGLGLLDKADVQQENPDWPAYKKYFMHGTSHHLGLDTHDYGALKTPMKPNMVFTVEPGIYIPAEGFGIRLEDDVVIQETGAPVNLMAGIPILAEEIEALMNA